MHPIFLNKESILHKTSKTHQDLLKKPLAHKSIDSGDLPIFSFGPNTAPTQELSAPHHEEKSPQ